MMESSLTTPYHRIAFPLLAFYDLMRARRAPRQLIRNQEALSEDLKNDPFLNSSLQRFTCELYYRFGSFLAPLNVGITTSRHYLSKRNKNGECGTGDNKNGGDEKTAK